MSRRGEAGFADIPLESAGPGPDKEVALRQRAGLRSASSTDAQLRRDAAAVARPHLIYV